MSDAEREPAHASDPVVVVCAADHRYTCPLAVMLRSLLSHLSPDRTLEVHVVDGGIGREEKGRVASSLNLDRATVRWLSPERSRFLGLPLWGRMPIATYDKLLVAELLPETARKALWLDCDLLVLADVADLWDAALGPHHALAVQDAIVPYVSSRFGVARYREAGLDRRAKYFNAGVMLMNLALWRRDDIPGRALAHLRRQRDRVYFWDQEGLNVALAGKWGELDARWNWNASVGALRAAGSDARIVHFSGQMKPWRYRGRGPYHALFYRFLDQTAWAGWRPQESWRAAALARYETSGLRRMVYPLEGRWMQLQRLLTRRYAADVDVRIVGGPVVMPGGARGTPAEIGARVREGPVAADALPPPGAPRMAVILATDMYETIRPVITCLRRQTIRDQLEIVIVVPAEGRCALDPRELREFGGSRVVEVASLTSLAAARAAGVHQASAPIVFIGETHTYPHPGWAEALLAAFERPWAAVVPAIGNANPTGVVSWAAYLSDYGRWGQGRPAGEIPDPLVYNTAYRRSVLLEVADDLERGLDPYSEVLWPALGARGHRAWFEPAARIDHLNVARPGSYFAEKWLAGLLIGTNRARRWSWWRRALYLLGSPLIPLVLVGRLLESVRRAGRAQRLPRGTFLAVAAGAVVKAAGEAVGYAGAAPASAEARMNEIEIHKVAYAARGPR